MSEHIDGICPECESDAEILPHPEKDNIGHIYCIGECRTIHRNLSGIEQYKR